MTPRPEPTEDALFTDVGNVRTHGVGNSQHPLTERPALLALAQLIGRGENDEARIEDVLRRAINRLGGKSGQAMLALLGLDDATWLNVTGRQEKAAQAFGKEPKTFRSHHEKRLLSSLATQLSVLPLVEPTARRSVWVEPEATRAPAVGRTQASAPAPRTGRQPNGLSGEWWQFVPGQGERPPRLDHVICRQRQEEISGTIRRLEPQSEAGRQWVFRGYVRGTVAIAAFLSVDVDYEGYGVLLLLPKNYATSEWDGFYVRLSRGRAVEQVPLDWMRSEQAAVAKWTDARG